MKLSWKSITKRGSAQAKQASEIRPGSRESCRHADGRTDGPTDVGSHRLNKPGPQDPNLGELGSAL